MSCDAEAYSSRKYMTHSSMSESAANGSLSCMKSTAIVQSCAASGKVAHVCSNAAVSASVLPACTRYLHSEQLDERNDSVTEEPAVFWSEVCPKHWQHGSVKCQLHLTGTKVGGSERLCLLIDFSGTSSFIYCCLLAEMFSQFKIPLGFS